MIATMKYSTLGLRIKIYIIGGRVIDVEQSPQQQYPLPPQSHTFSPPQVTRRIALHQLPLPLCGSGAMMCPDDDPLTSNFNRSNVGFQDNRRLSAVIIGETVGTCKKKSDYETVGNILCKPETGFYLGDHISVDGLCNGGNGREIAFADDRSYGACRGDHISINGSIEEATHVAQQGPVGQDDYVRNEATNFVEMNLGSNDYSPGSMPIRNNVPGDMRKGARTMSDGYHISRAGPRQQRQAGDRGVGHIPMRQPVCFNISSGCSVNVGDDVSGIMSLSSVGSQEVERSEHDQVLLLSWHAVLAITLGATQMMTRSLLQTHVVTTIRTVIISLRFRLVMKKESRTRLMMLLQV
jgi:hypothetical protein